MCGRGQHHFLQVQHSKYVQVALAEIEFINPTSVKVTFQSSIDKKPWGFSFKGRVDVVGREKQQKQKVVFTL